MSETVRSMENPAETEMAAQNPTQSETIEKLEGIIRSQNAEIEDLKQQLALLNRKLFGQRSEKTRVYQEETGQLGMFNEAETEAETTLKAEEKQIAVSAHKRAPKRTHKQSFEKLETEEVVHSAEDTKCPECGTEMEVIGRELVRSEVVYVPARLYVRKHYVEVLKCPACGDGEGDADGESLPKTQMRKAPAPAAMLPNSFCSPELLARIIFSKYVQAVPLYRQEKEYEALGLELSRRTMANWIIAAVARYAKPVWQAMKESLLQGSVIHADETVVQVLQEKDRAPKTKSRMWVYCTPSAAERQNVLFDYCRTRGGYNAENFLQGFRGHLVCDGYDGYNSVVSADVKRCGCWAHLRRKFIEALPSDEKLVQESYAKKGVDFCNGIFALEREYNGLDTTGKKVRDAISPEEKLEQRQTRSRAVADGLFAWLGTFEAAGGSKLQKAKQYACNEREYLYRFLENPYIEPDNNRAENAIRPFVVGRKNWLFAVSEQGAEASAILYSIAATAHANGLDIEKYFTDLFRSDASGKLTMPWPKTEEEKKTEESKENGNTEDSQGD